MLKLFSNLMKTINRQIQQPQKISSRRNMKKTKPRYLIIKLLKTSDKEKVLKAARKRDGGQRQTLQTGTKGKKQLTSHWK